MPVAETHAPPWHTLDPQSVLSRLGTSAGGLPDEEAARRLEAYGPNELGEARRVSPWIVLLRQFKSVLIVVLLLATAVSAYLGHGLEAVAITVIVLFAVVLGFVQEYRAERAIDALREYAAPRATVRRGGDDRRIPAREVVPGDLLVLAAGDRVAADARLVEAASLRADESPLTGESVPVDKTTQAVEDPRAAVGDRADMVFAGTAATYGRGLGAVVATGKDTEFGRVASLLETVEVGRTPLQERLDRLGRILAGAGLAVVVLVVTLGLARGRPFIEILVFGIALAVAVVPEALPAVVTISLALGVKRMVRRNVLVRRLPAVEALGGTSVICSDKTGTLTQNRMTVRRILAAGETYELTGGGLDSPGGFRHEGRATDPPEAVIRLLRAAALANDAHLEGDRPERDGGDEGNAADGPRAAGRAAGDDATDAGPRDAAAPSETEAHRGAAGDPTEVALVVAARRAGLEKETLEAELPRVDEVPFTSERKRMTTLHRSPGGTLACSKGATEVILEACTQRATPGGDVPLESGDRERILDASQDLATSGLRVLAVASKDGADPSAPESDLTFLGLVGMSDPPRPEARDAVAECDAAGIRTVLITGDHPLTARAVADELGILHSGRVVTGPDLDGMSDADLERDVEEIEVYARVSPEHKLRVVRALQARGHVTAMTGDGVNDAPALKTADIGVAMGIAGTDVAREAAAMILTDDNFASIVAAVEEGRAIFSNVKKYLMYLLSSNVGEIGLMAGASLLGLPLPLTAVQILWVNLATDGLPALALSVDPPEEDLMTRHPRDPREGIFSPPHTALILAGGIWSMLANLGIFAGALQAGLRVEEAMTLTFASLVLIQFFKAYNFRSDRHSILRRPFTNRWLNAAILWEIALLAAIVHVPFLHAPFGTVGLSPAEWALAAAVAFSVVPALEVAKRLAWRRRSHDTAGRNDDRDPRPES